MSKFLIAFIFSIALILRLWNLSSVPGSLSIDEVTFGYAGYSVLKTAHDEFGRFLPLAFEGVGDFKPPIDVYLNSLSIFLFGLNEFGVRFDGAILGSLTSIVVVFLLREFGLKKGAWFGGFWLATSGWHIFFSRAGYEAITASFFLVVGSYFFLRGVRLGKKFLIVFSILAFSFGVWSYHAERIFVPVLWVFLVFVFRKKLLRIFKEKKDYIFPVLVFGIFALPFIYLVVFSQEISARAMNLWLSQDPAIAAKLTGGLGDIGIISSAFVGQYLGYFDLKFLFWDGLRLSPEGFQGIGIFSLVDIPVVGAGIYQLITSKNKKLKVLMLVWLFLYPLPGAFARGSASPIRALVGIPFFAGSVGLGFEKLSGWWRNRFKFKFLYGGVMVLGLVYFFDMYVRIFPRYNADVWNYGYKEVAEYACENHDKYSQIIITDKYGIELPSVKTVPHYYILFHCKIDPALYLSNKELYNIYIRQPQWRIDRELKNALLIGSRWDFPEGFDMNKIMKTIYFSNGKAAFYFVETEK